MRIGKQYRIARSDLEAFTGTTSKSPRAATDRRVQVSSVVEIDAVERATADRLSTTVIAAATGMRVQTIYDEQRTRLKIMIFADPATTAAVLQIVRTLMETEASA